jgi:glucan phosphorylase
VLRDFHRVSPEKFFNVTNGVTPRRWIALSNPKLSALITRHIVPREPRQPPERSSSAAKRLPDTAWPSWRIHAAFLVR